MARNVRGFSHLRYFVGLAAAVNLLACATAFVPLDSRELLKNASAVGGEDEERGFGFFSNGVEANHLGKWIGHKTVNSELYNSLIMGGNHIRRNFGDVLADMDLLKMNEQVTKYNEKHPQEPISLLTIFKNVYDGKTIAKGIMGAALATKKSTLTEITSQLQLQLFKSWDATENPLHEAITALGLSSGGPRIFQGRTYMAFKAYVEHCLKKSSLSIHQINEAFLNGMGEAEYIDFLINSGHSSPVLRDSLMNSLFMRWFNLDYKPTEIRQEVFAKSLVDEDGVLSIPSAEDEPDIVNFFDSYKKFYRETSGQVG